MILYCPLAEVLEYLACEPLALLALLKLRLIGGNLSPGLGTVRSKED